MHADIKATKSSSIARLGPNGKASLQAIAWSPGLSLAVNSTPSLVELKEILDIGDIVKAGERAHYLLGTPKVFNKKERPMIQSFLLLIDGDQKVCYGNYDDAEVSYMNAYKAAKKSGDNLLKSICLYAMGMNMRGKSKYEQALKYFDNALKTNSRYVEALIDKGTVLMTLGKNKKALESFDKALAVELTDNIARNNKGAVLIQLGKSKDALTWFDLVLHIDKSDAVAWYNKGLALLELNRYEDASSCFENAFVFKDSLPDNGKKLYQLWTALMLSQGIKLIAANDIKKADRLILDFRRLVASANSDGLGHQIEEAINDYKSRLSKGEHEHFSLFEYKMHTMQDAMVLWGALRDWVSKKWPMGRTINDVIKEGA